MVGKIASWLPETKPNNFIKCQKVLSGGSYIIEFIFSFKEHKNVITHYMVSNCGNTLLFVSTINVYSNLVTIHIMLPNQYVDQVSKSCNLFNNWSFIQAFLFSFSTFSPELICWLIFTSYLCIVQHFTWERLQWI